jgi:RND superfamily putative drug exporter
MGLRILDRGCGRSDAVKRWGLFVHRRRWAVLGFSTLVFAASVIGLLTGGQLKNASDYNVEAVHGFRLEQQQLPATIGSSFGLIFTSSSHIYSDAAFRSAVQAAIAPLRSDARVTGIQTPYAGGTGDAIEPARLISTDRHSIIALAGLNVDFATARQQFGQLRAEVQSPSLSIATVGDVPLSHDFDAFLASDLQRAEMVSLPLALILLVIVFGTGVAALLCLGVGIFAVAGGMGATLLLAHGVDVSTYAINIVTLVGLGVAIDYSLFIVTRFREQLGQGQDPATALGVTMATAGRAILFSGITVAIGLGGLLFYTGTPLVSMGVAGAFVVTISVIYALTLLPALLAILGPRVNRLRLPILQPKPFGRGMWHRLATWVMQRPVLVLVPTVGLLLLAGSPFVGIRLANTDITQLPTTAESRQGSEILTSQFPQEGQNTIDVVMQFRSGGPTQPANIATAYTLSNRLRALPGVVGRLSYVDVDPSLNAVAYQQLYAHPVSSLPAGARSALTNLTGRNIAVLQVQTTYLTNSDDAGNLVRAIRANDAMDGATITVTGNTAFGIDFVDYMVGHTPPAIGFVVVTTFIVLLVLLRSAVLPIKAVLMNVLSLSAAFGALVWVFQEGHFSSLLGFTASPLDPTIPVLLFCIVFGLSMDYEVFLLTRMQERYRVTSDNRGSVADGLERSGRLVTGAAAIMATVFLAFALASTVTLIKSLGFGMAVAVIVDATLVRALVVPATMRLLGRLNWWAPKWLRLRAPLHKEELAEAV